MNSSSNEREMGHQMNEDLTFPCSTSWFERALSRKAIYKRQRRRDSGRFEGDKIDMQKCRIHQPSIDSNSTETICYLPFSTNFMGTSIYEALCLKPALFFNCFNTASIDDKTEEEHMIFDNEVNDDEYSYESTVPSIIILEDRQSSLNIDTGYQSGLVKSISNTTRYKMFQKVESLYSILDRDLRAQTATTTTTTSTSAENSFQPSSIIFTNNVSQDLSTDTATLSDNNDKDYFITRTVSSISAPSFDDNTLSQFFSADNDPLHIFNLQNAVIRTMDRQEMEESMERKVDVFRQKYRFSFGFCQECREDECSDLDLNVFIKDSLLSFDDDSLDIVDDVSYEDETTSIGLNSLQDVMRSHQFGQKKKANLDNVCQESMYSNSVESHEPHSFLSSE